MHSRLHCCLSKTRCRSTLGTSQGFLVSPQDLRDLAQLGNQLKRPRAMRSGRLKHQFPR